jgi:hypothetical protein
MTRLIRTDRAVLASPILVNSASWNGTSGDPLPPISVTGAPQSLRPARYDRQDTIARTCRPRPLAATGIHPALTDVR